MYVNIALCNWMMTMEVKNLRNNYKWWETIQNRRK